MTDEIVKTEAESNFSEGTNKAESALDRLEQLVSKFDVSKLEKSIADIADRVKALETPTDLPLKPKVSAEDDIGAKVEAPDTYQSNSEQASIRESKDNESDEDGLKMQKKSSSTQTLQVKKQNMITTSTPRPGAGLEYAADIIKSNGLEANPVLKACREQGFDNLSFVGKAILRGDYGNLDEGVPLW